MSNLMVSFKLPFNAVDNLRSVIRREFTRLSMEIDAARTLGAKDREEAMHALSRQQFQVEELARHFNVDLKEKQS